MTSYKGVGYDVIERVTYAFCSIPHSEGVGAKPYIF